MGSSAVRRIPSRELVIGALIVVSFLTVPALARAPALKDIQANDVVLIYETGLNVAKVNPANDGVSSFLPTEFRKYVNDDPDPAHGGGAGSVLAIIPCDSPGVFSVYATPPYQGFWYAYNSSAAPPAGKVYIGVNTSQWIEIAHADIGLDVVINSSHYDSANGKNVTRGTKIAFRLTSTFPAFYYKTASGTYGAKVNIEVTTPSGNKTQIFGYGSQAGGVGDLRDITLNSTNEFSDSLPTGSQAFANGAIDLTDVEFGTYTAVAKWTTAMPWYNLEPNSNVVTFNVDPKSRSPTTNGIQPGNVVFVYETGLDVAGVSPAPGYLPQAFVKYANDNPDRTVGGGGMELARIPCNPDDTFSVNVAPPYLGIWYAWNSSYSDPGPDHDWGHVNAADYIQIQHADVALDAVLNTSHPESIDGMSVVPWTKIAFKLMSTYAGNYYKTANGTYAARVNIEVTTPSGGKVQIFGNGSHADGAGDLRDITLNGSVEYTDTLPRGSQTFVNGAIDLTGAEAGTYTAIAKWTSAMPWYNLEANSNVVTFDVIGVPVVNFTASPTFGATPLTVVLTDLSLNTPTAWNWSFGDGTFSESQNNGHVYGSAGNYTVTLRASNAAGSNTSAGRTISVHLVPPVADFVATPTSGKAPLVVAFQDTSIGAPATSYSYQFGEGSSSVAKNPVFIYGSPGTYTINHSACNAAGCSWVTRNSYIVVSNPDPPAIYIRISGGSGYSSSSAVSGSSLASPDAGNPPSAGDSPASGDSQTAGDSQGTGAAPSTGSTGASGSTGSSAPSGPANPASGISGAPQAPANGPPGGTTIFVTIGNVGSGIEGIIISVWTQLGNFVHVFIWWH
jgi:PKD repeat protein